MWLQKASGIDCNVLKKITKRRGAILTEMKILIKTERHGAILSKSNTAEDLPEVK